jgi:glycosyltransferase involved in cell wall biosynthesis
MRLLVVTTLYPSAAEPYRAAFVPGRLAALAEHVELELIVPHSSGWSALGVGRVPKLYEQVPGPGFTIHHVTFRALPGIGRNRRPEAMAAAVRPVAAALDAARPFDVVLGQFLFPDAVAAGLVAEALELPLVVSAHGSDVYQHAAVPRRQEQIRQTLDRAAGLIVVSADLQRKLLALGLPADGAEVIPGGFQAEQFRPMPRDEARERLGLPPGPLLVYVGMLRDIKRVDVIVSALRHLPQLRAAIVGFGPTYNALKRLADRLKVADRIIWAGAQPHERVPVWMAAADVLALASEHEGTPTVLLEAMAMGTPVVATQVGGVPDLVGDLAPVVPAGNVAAMAEAIRQVLAAPPAAELLRARVETMTCASVAARYAAVLERAVNAEGA